MAAPVLFPNKQHILRRRHPPHFGKQDTKHDAFVRRQAQPNLRLSDLAPPKIDPKRRPKKRSEAAGFQTSTSIEARQPQALRCSAKRLIECQVDAGQGFPPQHDLELEGSNQGTKAKYSNFFELRLWR